MKMKALYFLNLEMVKKTSKYGEQLYKDNN